MLGIEDEYTAFCFDEACAFVISKIADGEEPRIQEEKENVHYSKPSDFYKQFDQEE